MEGGFEMDFEMEFEMQSEMIKYEKLRKELLGALIGLAKTCSNNPKTENTDRIIIEGLVAVNTPSFGEEMLRKKLERVRQEKHTIAPNCSTCASPCGNTSEYNLDLLKEEEAHCRAEKELILQEIGNAAVEFYRAIMLGTVISENTEIFYKSLEIVTYRMEIAELEMLRSEIAEATVRLGK